MRRYLVLILLTLATTSPQAFSDARIDAEFSKYNTPAGPGVAVLVVKNGQVIHKSGYGLADIEKQAPITPATNFNLASVSKQFTALVALQLKEQGKLSLDDLASKYVPELPPYAKDVRIRHLIFHTSGLPDYMMLCQGEAKVDNHSVLMFLKAQSALHFPAGKLHQYSNTGYVVLATILERITGKSLPLLLMERIFQPAGMTATQVYQPAMSTISNRARGHSEWPFFDMDDSSPCDSAYGDGGIYTSLNDIAKWVEALSSPRLLNADNMKLFFSQGATDDGHAIEYGFGWVTVEVRKKKILYHTGGWVGFRTIIAYVPSDDLWLVLLANHKGFSSEARALKLLRVIE